MPVAGERIAGRYLLDCRIAVGGMGAVWLGRDEVLRRPVAVKTLHLQAGLAPDDRELIVQRAMREARLTARLHHAHAVQVFDVLDEPDGPCLIMEYVPSRSLHDVVRTGGPLSVDDAARSGTQIAAALAAAHRAGIVHRDVKPGNVLIADDGTAKLTDFGISHAFDDASLTTTGMVTGTPAFLAPEVARGAPSSFASDVYSLGVTMYFAVDGDSPFGSGGNPMAVLHRVASEQPRPPRGAGPLAPLLREMMATRPEDRPRMVDIPVLLTDLHLVPADVAAQATEPLRAAAPPPSPTREFAAAAPPARPAPPAPPPPAPPPARPAADRAPTRAPASRPARPPSFERRRRGPLIAGLVVVAAVVGGVLLADSGGGGSTSADPSTSRSGSSPASRSQSPGPSTTAPGTSTSSSPTAGSTTGPSTTSQGPTTVSGKITDADLVSAVTQYFVLIPGDLDGAWARLTTKFQNGRAGGRQSFNDYWGGIERVDVADVQGNAPQAATAQLTYHYRTGKVVTQRTTFRFVREDGELKIDDES